MSVRVNAARHQALPDSLDDEAAELRFADAHSARVHRLWRVALDQGAPQHELIVGRRGAKLVTLEFGQIWSLHRVTRRHTRDPTPAARSSAGSTRTEIEHFCSIYKQLEQKTVDVRGWHPRERALEVIEQSREAYRRAAAS
ncbi:MAG TPA: inorganic diphosphatase [Solirubrobacteraceae bacterium]|nr:inorganic diphosphatase [Solirubrobacteraceae bacterium]